MAAAKHRELGGTPLSPAPSAFHLQAHRPAHLGHRSIAHHDERGILVAREADETERHLSGERRRVVEHHQRERAASQQYIGTPGPACRVSRPHHPQEIAVERRPAGRIEGARRIDAGHPLPPPQCRPHQCPHQRRRAGAGWADQFGEPPARQSAPQRFVEFTEPGGKGIGGDRGRRDDLLELGAKLG